jgi:hypothetical protein
MNECKRVKPKWYSYRNKYVLRNAPPYPANNCKTLKKRGNDNKYYVSRSDKNGVYKWMAVLDNDTRKNNITRKDLQPLIKKYKVTKSGTNKEIANRLFNKSHVIRNKTDMKIIEHFL